MTQPLILIIEDDDLQYEIYEEALSKYQLIRVKSGSEALDMIPKNPPNVIILDHVLDKGDLGLDYLPEIKELLPFVPVIIARLLLLDTDSPTTQSLPKTRPPFVTTSSLPEPLWPILIA